MPDQQAKAPAGVRHSAQGPVDNALHSSASASPRQLLSKSASHLGAMSDSFSKSASRLSTDFSSSASRLSTDVSSGASRLSTGIMDTVSAADLANKLHLEKLEDASALLHENFSTGLRCCGGRLSRLFASMASPRELAIQTRAYEIAIVVCSPDGGEAEPQSDDIVAALRAHALTVRSIAVDDDGEQKHLLLCNASEQLLAAQQKKILRNRWLRSTGAVSHPPSLADEVDEEGEPEHELTPALRVQALHDIISHCDISARAGSTGTASGGNGNGSNGNNVGAHEATLLRFDERVESIFPLHDAKANVGFARAVFGFDESGFRPGLKGLLLTTADVSDTPPDARQFLTGDKTPRHQTPDARLTCAVFLCPPMQLTRLREHFGDETAWYYAFETHYTRCLAFLAPVGIVFSMVEKICRYPPGAAAPHGLASTSVPDSWLQAQVRARAARHWYLVVQLASRLPARLFCQL